MAEIEEHFKTLRAELEAKGTIEHGLSTGRIELLGRAEVQKLVSEWWGGREAVRKLMLQPGRFCVWDFDAVYVTMILPSLFLKLDH